MNIYLNDKLNATGMVTFNNTPTIVYIESNGNGDKARMELTVTWGADGKTEYYITINGSKIVAVNNINEAVGNAWWTPITLVESGNNYAATSAYTIARALNNTELSNNYNIYIDTQTAERNKVIIEAKEKGKQYNINNIETNAPWVKHTSTNGSSSDLMDGSMVILDVYANDNPYNQNDINGNGGNLKHVATFQKRYYKNGISFNISPILNDLCKSGETLEYNVIGNFITGTEMRAPMKLMHNYASNGYQCNLGLDFIPKVGDVYFAQNVNRGEERATLNNTTLYYSDTISFSVYKGTKGTLSYQVKYLDSALNPIKSVDMSFNCTKPLNHISFTPESGYYYCDVVLPTGTIRYNNIRPTKYANPSDVQTVYWYNSYGGVSFFPFTLKKEENRESEKILYQHSNLNYYNDTMKSYNKVYTIENEYEVTLQSHLMDKNGTYTLNDLLNSMEAWTYVGRDKYEIIIKSVEIEEQSNNGVYIGTVKFMYSLPDRW